MKQLLASLLVIAVLGMGISQADAFYGEISLSKTGFDNEDKNE